MANLSPARQRKEVATVGVIVGRFQVPHLHEVHEELIRHVASSHPKTLIFLGLSPCKGTMNNPLDFEARKEMILEKFPKVTVLYIKDRHSDQLWSESLDKQINDMLGPNDSACLYGGRDSFISHYKGKHQTQELESDRIISGSEIRREVSKRTRCSPDFREGVIWAVGNRYPITFTTVDVAIFNEDYTKMLMARKPDEKDYRFVGGFTTPQSKSFEEDARREVMEETGLCEVGPLEYLGSYFIDDWRYRSEIDKIKTIFFATKFMYGRPVGADDVAEVRWVNILTPEPGVKLAITPHGRVDVSIVKEHYELTMRALEYAQSKREKVN